MEKSTVRVPQAFTYSFTNTFRGKPPPPKAHHVHCENSKRTHQWGYSKSREAVTGEIQPGRALREAEMRKGC